MKVMLGNGWYQEVTVNNEGEEVIRYMKDGKEYSREEWKKSQETNVTTTESKELLNNETLNEIRSGLDHSLGGIYASIEVLNAVQIETGRIEDDVVNMDVGNLTNMGLMMNDMQHKLIMINNLLFHTLRELEGKYTEANSYKQRLYEYEVIEENENTLEPGQEQGQ